MFELRKRLLTNLKSTGDFRDPLLSSSFALAYHQRIGPNKHDDFLLDEFSRSIGVMPLDLDERQRLITTIKAIRDAHKPSNSTKQGLNDESIDFSQVGFMQLWKLVFINFE